MKYILPLFIRDDSTKIVFIEQQKLVIMKKISSSIILFALLHIILLSACNETNEEVNLWKNKSEIRTSVYYISNFSGDTIPDVGAKIYFYYNMNASDISQYETYLSNGIFRNRYDASKIIESDTIGFVPESGTFVLDNIDKSIDDIIMIIESNHYNNPQQRLTVYALFLKTSSQPRVFKNLFLPAGAGL